MSSSEVFRRCWVGVALLVVLALSAGGCGGGGDSGPRLHEDLQRELPLEVGELNELCTKLPSEWASAVYQRTRRRRLNQADALTRALRQHPDAVVDADFIDVDSGDTVHVDWTVTHLAQEQLRAYAAARYCTRPGTPTSRSAASAALKRIRTLKRLVDSR